MIFWVSAAFRRRFFAANVVPLASEAVALHHLHPRTPDHRPLHPPIPTRPVWARCIAILPLFLAYRPDTLPLRHADHLVRHPLDGLWNFRSPAMLQGPRLTLHLRALHQTRAPADHLWPIQLRPASRLSRFAVPHGRVDLRGFNSRKLDHRMRDWVTPSRCDVRYTVRLDLVVGLHRRSWIHEGRSRGRADEG